MPMRKVRSWADSDQRDRLSGADLRVPRAVIAGRQDVGEQHRLLHADSVRHAEQRGVGIGNRSGLGLSAGKLARAPEHARLVALAADRMSAGAAAALTATDHARDDDPISAAEATLVAARLDDLTH